MKRAYLPGLVILIVGAALTVASYIPVTTVRPLLNCAYTVEGNSFHATGVYVGHTWEESTFVRGTVVANGGTVDLLIFPSASDVYNYMTGNGSYHLYYAAHEIGYQTHYFNVKVNSGHIHFVVVNTSPSDVDVQLKVRIVREGRPLWYLNEPSLWLCFVGGIYATIAFILPRLKRDKL